jgi:hypothetical protein
MSIVYSENATHRAALLAAENTRNASYAAAAGNQASIKAADIVYARAALASAKANNCGAAERKQLEEMQSEHEERVRRLKALAAETIAA